MTVGIKTIFENSEPHQAIQAQLRQAAQLLGFLAEVEKQLRPGSQQAADLTLKRGGLAIAVEIAVETTNRHELENIQKCRQAGFQHVAVVSPHPQRLTDLAALASAELPPEVADQVGFYSPEDFILHLRRLAAQWPTDSPAPPATAQRRGFAVRRKFPALDGTEQQSRDARLHRLMAGIMGRKPQAG